MPDLSDISLMQMAQETERRRIARELHDNAVQTLSALVTDLERFQLHQAATIELNRQELLLRVDRWQELARNSLISLRNTLDGLRTHSDLEFNLLTLVRTLQDDMHHRGFDMLIDITDWPPSLPYLYSSNLYYCIYEALTNVRKHAQAKKIHVFLFSNDISLHVSIVDDGIGLPTEPVPAPPGTQQGLIGLRERVSLLGGELTLASNPGQGTRVDIAVPRPL